MSQEIFDLALRVSTVETKLNILIAITAAIALPVHAQFVNLVIKKFWGKNA